VVSSNARTPATAPTVYRGPIVDCLGQTRDDNPSHNPVQRRLAIVVSPVPARPGHFAARLDGDSKVLCTSRAPFLDSARVLLAEGHDPTISLVMLHDGAAEFALRAPLGVAAQLAVEETAHGPVFRRHRIAPPSAVAAPRIAAQERGASPAPETAGTATTVRTTTTATVPTPAAAERAP
jgi:hypothetical protein